MIRAVAALAVAAMLAACSSPPPAGHVTDRRHQPATSWVQFIPVGNGVQVPIVYSDPESWSLQIGDDTTRGWVAVDHATFDHCQLGDWWPTCGEGR